MSYESSLEELCKRVRPMGIRLNGIWQPGVGNYVTTQSPYLAKIVLNGKEFVVNETDFLDLDGYDDAHVENYIIQRNIQTLPPPKKKKPTGRTLRDIVLEQR